MYTQQILALGKEILDLELRNALLRVDCDCLISMNNEEISRLKAYKERLEYLDSCIEPVEPDEAYFPVQVEGADNVRKA